MFSLLTDVDSFLVIARSNAETKAWRDEAISRLH